jgi:site-specific DNA recombinase
MKDTIVIEMTATPAPIAAVGRAAANDAEEDDPTPIAIRIPWSLDPTRCGREIILPAGPTRHDRRPIRAETRATLVRSVALGRLWLSRIVDGTVTGPDAIAAREGCSPRHVTRILSLAFLAPDLVKAAIEGRLPRGVGVTRLVDPPIAWSRQWAMLGL